MKGKGLLLSLSSLTLLVCVGIKPALNMVSADEETSSMPSNWNVSYADDDGNSITSPYLKASAYKDSQRGNSLMMYRRISSYNLTCSSSSFAASSDTSYKLTFFYKSDCLHDDENKISASIIENKNDGTTSMAEVISAKGRQGSWKSFSGYYTTSNKCENLVITFSSYGMGDFFVNSVSLKGKPAPSTFFNDYGMETVKEDQGEAFSELSSSYLSDDAYRGERSIKLTNQGFRTNFAELPAGEYELKFKYKHDYEDGSRLSIRLDNVSFDGTSRAWYGTPVSSSGTGGGWSSYSYKFKKLNEGETNFCSINYIKIFSYGTFLIDDLEVIGSDNFNFVVGGSFEGYDVDGVSFNGSTGIVKDTDDSLVYAGSYDGIHGSNEPSLTFDCSKLNLTIGNTYTLTYQYRGGFYETASAYYGSTKIYTGSMTDTWANASASFVAEEGKNIRIKFCASSPRMAYIRNVSLLDSDNNECMTLGIKEYSSTGGDETDSFPYGGFDYDFPSNPDDSSSITSSEDENFSRETKDSEEESSSSRIDYGTSSDASNGSNNSSSGEVNPSNRDNGSNSALTGLTIGLLAVASVGLAVAIFALIRGKKHGK